MSARPLDPSGHDPRPQRPGGGVATADRPAAVRAEAPLTLLERAPRTLGLFDQLGLWVNLGVSLLGPVGAIYLLQPVTGGPRMSLAAAGTALVVGSLLGAVLIGLSAVPGARTGAPAMVLLRGLLGARLSLVPTVLNVVQLLGWGVFEIVVITAAADQLLPWSAPHWLYVVLAGILTTALALHPLGAVRVLRRYALVAVTLCTVYLFVQLLRRPLPSLTAGSWSGFWPAMDYSIAVAVSFVPIASDYARHARRPRSAFLAPTVGYTLAQVAYYALGLVALSTVVRGDAADLQHDMFAAFLAVPVGWLAFGVLVLRELDQSFADTYSTVVSIQNIAGRLDRRLLAVAVGGLSTVLALTLDIDDYASFLTLLGSVFVPMFAVFVADYYLLGGGARWDTSAQAPSRPWLLLPWAGGFVVYQLINPGSVGGWTSFWSGLGVHTPGWAGASLSSFVVALALTVLVGGLRRRPSAR